MHFLNADKYEMAIADRNRSSCSTIFAYGYNDPINKKDPSGNFVVAIVAGAAITAADCAAVLLAAFLSTYWSSKSVRKVVDNAIMSFADSVYRGVEALQADLSTTVKKVKTNKLFTPII
mgnify:FL=1